MEEYYFLFALAGVWILFAAIQDLKREEIPNWISYSLLAFALSYRAFYSAAFNNWNFLAFGVLGFVVFYALANGFYYARIFGGGDARLLMALGAVLPFESLYGMLLNGVGFLFVMFGVGAIYTLFYSIGIACSNWSGFKVGFENTIKKYRLLMLVSPFIGLVFMVLLWNLIGKIAFWFFVLFAIIPLLYAYLVTLEQCCMLKLLSPDKLAEGDWLERDVVVSGKRIKKSVHGLSMKDIIMLRKAHKKVWIKKGVPFAPSFLITWIVMVFFYLVFQLGWDRAFSFLS
jgi:Flp pilus assembly protein protease CpaA